MYFLFKFCIIFLLICIKCIGCIRRLSFINRLPPGHAHTFLDRSVSDRLGKFKKHMKKIEDSKEGRDLKMFATSVEDLPNLQDHKRDFSNCPSFDEIFNKSYVFSNPLLDLDTYDYISRELDQKYISKASTKNIKRFIAIVMSTFALGVLYKFGLFIKDLVEEQFQNLYTSNPV